MEIKNASLNDRNIVQSLGIGFQGFQWLVIAVKLNFGSGETKHKVAINFSIQLLFLE